MKIETVPAPTSFEAEIGETRVMRLRVTGPVDRDDAVVRKARELVAKTGSQSMADSFEWALAKGAFVSVK